MRICALADSRRIMAGYPQHARPRPNHRLIIPAAMSKPRNSPVPPTDFPGSLVREDTAEYGFIGTLQKLK